MIPSGESDPSKRRWIRSRSLRSSRYCAPAGRPAPVEPLIDPRNEEEEAGSGLGCRDARKEKVGVSVSDDAEGKRIDGNGVSERSQRLPETFCFLRSCIELRQRSSHEVLSAFMRRGQQSGPLLESAPLDRWAFPVRSDILNPFGRSL